LGPRVFADRPALRRLEGIIHPMVRRAEKRFVGQARARREPLVVLDIPLLFESGGDDRVDFVLVVTAPLRLQRERVMRRRGMSEDRLAEILRAQMPDREKRRRADFVVATALGRGATFRRLKAIVRMLRQGIPARRDRGRRRCARL
jgi:dephospho-CoA kinase